MKCNYCICKLDLWNLSFQTSKEKPRPSKCRANKVQFTICPANSTTRSWNVTKKGCKMTEATWQPHWLPISNKNTPVQSWVLPLLAQPLQGFPTMFFWRSSRVPRTRCSACLANFSHILPWGAGKSVRFSTGNFYGPLPMALHWWFVLDPWVPRMNQQKSAETIVVTRGISLCWRFQIQDLWARSDSSAYRNEKTTPIIQKGNRENGAVYGVDY